MNCLEMTSCGLPGLGRMPEVLHSTSLQKRGFGSNMYSHKSSYSLGSARQTVSRLVQQPGLFCN